MLRPEKKDRRDLDEFATNIDEAIAGRTHVLRELMVKWVAAPIVIGTAGACLLLFLLDAFHTIPPLRDEWVTVVRMTLLGEGIGAAVGGAFGWLYGQPKKAAKKRNNNSGR